MITVDIYRTESNANLLSGELATVLGGRYVQFEIYPFIFSKYVEGGRPFPVFQNFEYRDRKYIQVSDLLVSEETRKQEFRALQEMKVNYEKIVLSLDSFTSDKERIKHFNLIKWLLADNES